MQKTFALQAIACSLLVAICCAGCAGKKAPEKGGLDQLSITWTLLGNQPDETCQAAFTFYNTGRTAVARGDWALYFNQNTLQPGKMPNADKGIVEHINGDLYRFLPGPAFTIAPGDSLTVRYAYRGMMIKMSDAPAGAYLVSGLDRNKDSAFLPKAFRVTPFDQPAKLFPIPLPWPPSPLPPASTRVTSRSLFCPPRRWVR